VFSCVLPILWLTGIADETQEFKRRVSWS